MSASLHAARSLYARLLEAWNDGDAAAFAYAFADDGIAIGFDGSQMEGRAIETGLRGIFAAHPTARYVARISELRHLSPGVILLRADCGMVPPGSERLDPAVNALQSMVAQEIGGRWRIALFQNTPAQYHGRPDLAGEHTRSLEALLGGPAVSGGEAEADMDDDPDTSGEADDSGEADAAT